MAPAATATANANAQAPAAPSVPFLAGSWEYTEPLTTAVVTTSASQQDFVYQITPGGFLRGVTFQVTSTGGALGGGALAADSPWSLITNVSLESIDGTPLIYPISGYVAYLVSKYTRPWDGDPAADPGFSNTVNPAFNLRLFIESRMTIGVLPNTDARAQYRIRLSIAPTTGLIVGGAPTAPTVTIAIAAETYAQPPFTDYADNAIAQLPDGLCLQRFISQEQIATNAGNAQLKSNRVGNLIRTMILVFRNSAGARVDLTADPIRWRLDNTQLLNENRAHRVYEMNREYQFGEYTQQLTANRPTGVYVYPRYHNPGSMQGMYWLPTTEATYLMWEVSGASAGGTCQIVTEDFSPTMGVPAYLQGL